MTSILRAPVSRRGALRLGALTALASTAPVLRPAFASPTAATFDLPVERIPITIDGATFDAIAMGGSVPAPTLRWRDGQRVTINVTNRLDEPTSIHWHGLLLPGPMDGAPGFNGFQPIMPGETRVYQFDARQSGTYWYHSHSGGQEQQGMYGAIVIDPKGREPVKADREHVVVLSDHTPESPLAVLRKLKVVEGYYNRGRRTLSDFMEDVKRDGLSATLGERADWGRMRMDATDLADVTGYQFLVNGRGPDQPWWGQTRAGERVRLRIVNASAMTIFDVAMPGAKMTVVAADGQNVEPVTVDEFRFGPGETYDVVIKAEDRAQTLVAEPIDRSGVARAILAPAADMTAPMPPRRARAVLTMADMGEMHGGAMHGGMTGMDHAAMGHGAASPAMPGMDHSRMDHSQMDHAQMDHAKMGHGEMAAPTGPARAVGWADAGTPPGARALTYADLKFPTRRPGPPPSHEIKVVLGGMMGRYIWTLNGATFDQGEAIRVKYGYRVRIRFVNETMMAHPMHLHGMFMELENGQGERRPNKHVVLVPPGQEASVLVTADEPGEWPFHCHLLFHMATGMMTRFIVEPRQNASL